MHRLKLILVLAVVVVAALAVTAFVNMGDKTVVLDPVKTIPNQVVASTTASGGAVLKISSGNVSVLLTGEVDWQAGAEGMEIVTGTRIKTDSTGRASIEYPGGTVTRLDYDSEVLVETLELENSNIVVRLFGGRIWSRVSKMLGRVSYESRSTNVVASVRGTEYEHDLKGGVDSVMVAESNVDVSCINGKKKALLRVAEKMAMDCGDGSAVIKEIITSETINESTQSGELVAKIEAVDEEELNDDWSRFNGAREVIRKARQMKREELLNSSESGVLTFRERIRGELVDESDEKSDDITKKVDEDFVKEDDEKLTNWWSKISQWRRRNAYFNKTSEGAGKLKLKCENNCTRLVVETEGEFESGTAVNIEILKENGKRIGLGEVDRQGKVLSSNVDRGDICSGGEFDLKLVYENGSQVEYRKFNSNDLNCNQ